MSGLNGQFNARLQRLEKMQDSETEVPKPTSADAGKVITVNQDGDGYELVVVSGGGLVEIKNVEPFQVPDLVNGGTRLFDPAHDSLFYKQRQQQSAYTEMSPFFVSNDTPPGVIYIAGINYITTNWLELQTYENPNADETPHFCVEAASMYGFMSGDITGFIVKPENIVYRYTTSK